MRDRSWVIAIALIPCWTCPVSADDAEDDAIVAIGRLGGQFSRDETILGKRGVFVNLNFVKDIKLALNQLGALKRLTRLSLSGTTVADSMLKDIGQLKSITSLNLSYTQLTDAGVKELAGLTNLTYLDLNTTK